MMKYLESAQRTADWLSDLKKRGEVVFDLSLKAAAHALSVVFGITYDEVILDIKDLIEKNKDLEDGEDAQ